VRKLAAVEVRWANGPGQELDVRGTIKRACRKDKHPLCRQWRGDDDREDGDDRDKPDKD
jgi:hypothetical protein